MTSRPSRHSSPVRFLLGWIDSNELPWTFPLPPWYPARTRALRRLRILARARLRRQLVAAQGWPRTLVQALLWPGMSVLKTILFLRSHPLPPGAGPWQTLREAAARWWLLFAHNLRLSDQDVLFLHLPANRKRPAAFIICRENQALIDLAGLRTSGFPDIELKNPFARFCDLHDLPTATALLTGCGSSVQSSRPVPAADLFLKLANSGKGKGAEILFRAPAADGWLGAGGEFLSAADLPGYALSRLGDGQEWIFQERLQNASSWAGLTPGALATARIITTRPGPSAPPEYLSGYIRFPRQNAMVDNLAAGGIGSPIDPATGRLEAARDWINVQLTHERHPDTGAPIADVLLPGWSDLLALALRAHSHAGHWLAIGWDVTLTSRGPMLIEANLNWAMPPFAPAEDSRYIEMMNSVLFPPAR